MNLPIAERELRIAARTPRTYRSRMVSCLIFSAIAGWMFWFSHHVGPLSMVGPQTFAFISYTGLLMCMFSVNVTADVLSVEKRNGTLGLLFLTDLKGADIVFGKLAAYGLIAFYSLVGMIPVLAMSVLMGGISGQSVFRTALTLANALFLSLSIGLWISSRSWEQKRAMNAAVAIMVSLVWIVPGITTAMRFRYPEWVWLAELFCLLSPVYQQQHGNPFGIGMRVDHYWWSLGATHALAWLALWRACAVLPRTWQDRATGSAKGRFKKWWQELKFGSPEARALLRLRLLRINAVHWLSSREKFAPATTWLALALVLAVGFGFWLWFKAVSPGPPPIWCVGIFVLVILVLVFRIRVAASAGEVIVRDRFSGALELLLSSALTEKDVVRGQWLTVARIYLGPTLATLLISALVFAGILSETAETEKDVAWVTYFGLLIMFGCDLVASVWTGMWMACISRNPAAAPGMAVLRLFVLPWFAFIGLMSLGAWLDLGRNVEFPNAYVFWWLLCMANNFFWIIRSRSRFYERLRTVASERYQPAPARIAWWRLLLGRR